MADRSEAQLRGLSLEELRSWSTCHTPHYHARYSGSRSPSVVTPRFATTPPPGLSRDLNTPRKPTWNIATPTGVAATEQGAVSENFAAAVQSLYGVKAETNSAVDDVEHILRKSFSTLTLTPESTNIFIPHQSTKHILNGGIDQKKAFDFRHPYNMVREVEPARNPLAPATMNTLPTLPAQTGPPTSKPTPGQATPADIGRQDSKQVAAKNETAIKTSVPAASTVQAYQNLQDNASPRPVFGQPTTIGRPQAFPSAQSLYQPTQNPLGQRQVSGSQSKDKYSNLFVPNKSSQQKPTLHKPQGISNPLQAFDRQFNRPGPPPPPPSAVPTSATQIASTARPPRRIIDSDDEDSVYEIAAPKDLPRWQPKAASQPSFSSDVNSNPYFKPKASTFIDLTVDNTGFATNRSMFHQDQERWEPLTYMDTEKATENIKALLEGALEDDDDKPVTRKQKKQTEEKMEHLTKQLNEMAVVSDGTSAKPTSVDASEDEQDGEAESSVEGLKVRLLPHQVAGVRWMCEKEIGNQKTRGVLPKGGILADDMGLGKTIQSIALILKNPRTSWKESKESELSTTSQKPKPRGGTLVIAPLALIKQWEGEIKDRVEEDHALKVCVHHGPQRAKSFKDLKKYDVVITTYNTLTSEHAGSEGSLLVGCFGLKWHRVILDEAHSIKNRNAKATKAACFLDAEYRWCLTGTPMQNNLDELQSLIHFLRIKPYEDLNAWRDQITKPMMSGRGGLAIKRLQVYLKAFMKRRTKDVLKQNLPQHTSENAEQDATKANGFRIVNRTVKKVEATFSREEREFYKKLESRADKSLEQMMAGNKMSYASALVLLMRLRQACNHPQLTGSDLLRERDTTRGNQSPKKKQVAEDDMDAIANMLGGLTVETKRCDMCLIELTQRESSAGAVRCRECEADLQAQKSKTSPAMTKHEKRSKVTHVQVSRPVRTQNRRVVVDSDDEDEIKVKTVNDGNDRDTDNLYPKLKALESNEHSEDEDDDHDDGQVSASQDEEDDDSNEDDDNEIYESDGSSAEPTIMQSTKIRHLLRILQEDSHTHKYIVFSFFTSMLDLIEPFLQQQSIRYVRYDGQMRNDAREASLHALRSDDRIRVLLCSLRAGSLGLNLTAASRVVILEPFWNPFVEEQAIDRVHRLNQTQDVIVHKITVQNTVEARILELQEKKRELANATIEGRKDGAGKLTLQDMLKLFRHDAEQSHKVDMIGMKDRTGLLDRAIDTAEDSFVTDHTDTSQLSQRSSRGGTPEVQAKAGRRKDHEVYGRRW